jgi:N,N'-diacetylchitobiose non-reducing end deacetylase
MRLGRLLPLACLLSRPCPEEVGVPESSRRLEDRRRLKEYLSRARSEPWRVGFMERAERIISFAPHPDDSDQAAGGYIAKRAAAGAEVKLVVVTDGRLGIDIYDEDMPSSKLARLRKAEQLKAAKALGIEDVSFLGYRDAEAPHPDRLAKVFVGLIRGFGPDLVLALDPDLPHEAHPDHVYTGRAVLRAVMFHEMHHFVPGAKVLSDPPSVALGRTARPNAAIQIDRTVATKAKAMACHATQFKGPADARRRALSAASALGPLAGSRYAEAFRFLDPSELHVNLLAGL